MIYNLKHAPLTKNALLPGEKLTTSNETMHFAGHISEQCYLMLKTFGNVMIVKHFEVEHVPNWEIMYRVPYRLSGTWAFNDAN